MRPVTLTTEFAERMEVTYSCDSDHSFVRTFAADAAVPTTWDCPHCGKMGSTNSVPETEGAKITGKSHWEMVLERRSMDELKHMFTDRLKEVRHS